ncbi:putative uncharacterized protein DDB_G0277255 [Panonychus citri]|uniref:putative uncharacterized protein DDB_G0277255 n=1 Tax=Panonychus citri TaxID=50023 RepID=UPI00230710FE|nr:putative uncharacterized protein DDB_G0277255 [Panonychus citri]
MVKSEPLIVDHFHTSDNMNFILSSSSSPTSSSSSSLLHFPSTNHVANNLNPNCSRNRTRNLTKSTIISINKPISSPTLSSSTTTTIKSPQGKQLVSLIPKVTTNLSPYQSTFNCNNQGNTNHLNQHPNDINRPQASDYFHNLINCHQWNANDQQSTHNPYQINQFQIGLNHNDNNLYLPYHHNQQQYHLNQQHCSSSSIKSSTSPPSSPVSPLIVNNQLKQSPSKTSDQLIVTQLSCNDKLCPCLKSISSTESPPTTTINCIQIPDSSSSPLSSSSSSSSSSSTKPSPMMRTKSNNNNLPTDCPLICSNTNNHHPNSTNGKSSSKPRRRVATMAQRRAANIRERRRMYHLNTAFDKLRKKVPTFAYEKRLSRIETLRLAVMYITFMTEILRGGSAEQRIPLHPSNGSFQNHQINIETSSSSSSSSSLSSSSSPTWDSHHNQ